MYNWLAWDLQNGNTISEVGNVWQLIVDQGLHPATGTSKRVTLN